MAFDGFAQLVDRRPSGIVLSPSQLEKYVRCHRAWAFEYIGGLRPPPKPSAELGTHVHAILEAWLMYGTPPDIRTKAGKIAAKMIANLPLPGTGVTERSSWFVTRNGFAYTFKIDWSGIFFQWPTIIDHKTTGSLEWAKTEAGLHCDVQAVTYTIAGCLGFAVDDIQLMWNYGTTKDKDPIVVPVRTRMRLQIAQEKFERVVEPIAAEIVAARTSRLNPHAFPPNPDACGDFGGCPHKHICNLTQEERLRALMNDQGQPTLAARLSTMPQGGFVPPGNGYAPPPNGAPAAGYAPVQQQGFVPPQPQQQQPQQLQQPQQPQQLQQQPQYVAPPQQGFVPPQATTNFQPPQPGAPAAQAAFVPPQGTQMPLAFPSPVQQGIFPPGSPTVVPPFNPNQGPNPPESGAQMPQQQQASGEPEKTKRGRGRPRKADDETQNVAPVVELAKQIYADGVVNFMRNPNWNGSIEQLIWAGDIALQAFHARFG